MTECQSLPAPTQRRAHGNTNNTGAVGRRTAHLRAQVAHRGIHGGGVDGCEHSVTTMTVLWVRATGHAACIHRGTSQ